MCDQANNCTMLSESFYVPGAINSPEGNLIESLLFNSSRFARPTKNASKPVKVEFGIELVQLQELVRFLSSELLTVMA